LVFLSSLYSSLDSIFLKNSLTKIINITLYFLLPHQVGCGYNNALLFLFKNYFIFEL
jgi:hypothetical protein